MSQSVLVLAAVVLFAISTLAVWKRRLALKAETWPTVSAEIENVFLDYTGGAPRFWCTMILISPKCPFSSRMR